MGLDAPIQWQLSALVSNGHTGFLAHTPERNEGEPVDELIGRVVPQSGQMRFHGSIVDERGE